MRIMQKVAKLLDPGPKTKSNQSKGKQKARTKSVAFTKEITISKESQPPTGSSSSSKIGSSRSSSAISAVTSGQQAMKVLTGNRGKLKDLTGVVDRDEHQYIGGGAFGDVYKGIWKDDSVPRTHSEVVVKVLRSTGTIDPKALAKRLKVSEEPSRVIPAIETSQELRRELTVWQTLDHKNIVPFVGIALISGLLPSIVSAWMPQGTLRSYLTKRKAISREALALDIAQGLKYLHGGCILRASSGMLMVYYLELKPPIIHGDLKADNVLIDSEGSACLCDFGLSRMLEETTLWKTSATSAPGTVRWKAPELLNGQQRTVTIEADMYAYGMTCFEVYTGQVPFQHYRNDWMVMQAVIDKQEIPQRPTNMWRVTGRLWKLWVDCWDRDHIVRPTAMEAVTVMLQISTAHTGQILPLGEADDEEEEGGDEDFPSTPTLTMSSRGIYDLPLSSYGLRSRIVPRWSRMPLQSFIEQLSDELLLRVFRWCYVAEPPSQKMVMNLRSVCSRWRRIVGRDEVGNLV